MKGVLIYDCYPTEARFSPCSASYEPVTPWSWLSGIEVESSAIHVSFRVTKEKKNDERCPYIRLLSNGSQIFSLLCLI